MILLDGAVVVEGTKIKELPFYTQWNARERNRRSVRVDKRVCIDGTFAHHWQIKNDIDTGNFDSCCSRCDQSKQFCVPGYSTDPTMEYEKNKTVLRLLQGVA